MTAAIPLKVGEHGDLIPPEELRHLLVKMHTQDVQAEICEDGRVILTFSAPVVQALHALVSDANFADDDDVASVQEELAAIRRDLFRERYGVVG